MGDKTAISWADATLNPIRRRSPSGKLGHACLKVSPGCDHCYAGRMQPVRFDGPDYRPESRESLSLMHTAVAVGDLFLDQAVLEQALRWRNDYLLQQLAPSAQSSRLILPARFHVVGDDASQEQEAPDGG